MSPFITCINTLATGLHSVCSNTEVDEDCGKASLSCNMSTESLTQICIKKQTMHAVVHCVQTFMWCTAWSYLLNILFKAPGEGHMHNPPHPLRIHPHPKGNSSHHHFGLAGTEGLLDVLPVLHKPHSCASGRMLHLLKWPSSSDCGM